MATGSVNLDTAQYVKVNIGYTSMLLQAHRDSVRVVLSTAQPGVGNTAYHMLDGGDAPLPLPYVDVNVWALAQSIKSSLIVTEAPTATPSLPVDSAGEELGTEANPIEMSETLHPTVFNEYAHQHTGVSSTLTAATTGSGHEYIINVVNGALFTVGDDLQISDGLTESTFARIISIAVNAITLDRRIDFAHPIGTTVEIITFELAIVGTLAVPEEFIIAPEGSNVVHIQRITMSMVHPTKGDMALFGDLPPLLNGVLVRVRQNGSYRTLTNWKNNEQLKDDMFDIVFDTRASGGGSYGTSGRWTFERFGAEVRLDAATGDQMEIYIQDVLTDLTHFSVKAQGHYK